MTCHQAPACRAVLDQASERWPNRNRASDGICASPRHSTQNPTSDHEPRVKVGGKGYATAVDLTDDKANGCDADAWADWLIANHDPRVKYVIRNREMASSYPTSRYPAWTWRPYTGSNPHASHTHLSIVPEAIFDTSPWFPTEDDMPLGKDIDDDRRSAIRGWCWDYWGQGPTLDEQDYLLAVWHNKGMDAAHAAVADDTRNRKRG